MFGIFKRVADLERRVKVLQDNLRIAEDTLYSVCEVILVAAETPKKKAKADVFEAQVYTNKVVAARKAKLDTPKKKRGRPRKIVS